MTVQELLTGEKLPLSHQEFVRWYAYYRVKANREEQAQKRAAAKSRRRR